MALHGMDNRGMALLLRDEHGMAWHNMVEQVMAPQHGSPCHSIAQRCVSLHAEPHQCMRYHPARDLGHLQRQPGIIATHAMPHHAIALTHYRITRHAAATDNLAFTHTIRSHVGSSLLLAPGCTHLPARWESGSVRRQAWAEVAEVVDAPEHRSSLRS